MQTSALDSLTGSAHAAAAVARPARRIKIAHVIFRLDMGGLENGLINLVNRLDEDVFDHAIVCLEEPTSFAERIATRNTKVYTVDKRPGKDPHVYLRLYRLLRQLRPDIVHTRNLATVDMTLPAFLARVPRRIHGEHGWDIGDLRGTRSRHHTIRKICQPFIHRFVCVSRHLQEWLESVVGVPSSKIVCIANGVDTTRFAPRKGSDDSAVLGQLPNDAIVIGAVGRLVALKNHRLLIGAFGKLLKAEPRHRAALRLAIVGDGPEHAALAEQARAAGLAEHVIFTGRRDDIDRLMRRFDIFALPSLNEGMSNTLLEAMAAGAAVVASNVGGNSELVTDEVSGLLVPSDDEAALVRSIRRYVTDPALRSRHASAARAEIEQRFSLDAMVAGYSSLYQQVLAAPRATQA
jgi:sugar transferase (PEP-CTERM/EpsH1 system associated)